MMSKKEIAIGYLHRYRTHTCVRNVWRCFPFTLYVRVWSHIFIWHWCEVFFFKTTLLDHFIRFGVRVHIRVKAGLPLHELWDIIAGSYMSICRFHTLGLGLDTRTHSMSCLHGGLNSQPYASEPMHQRTELQPTYVEMNQSKREIKSWNILRKIKNTVLIGKLIDWIGINIHIIRQISIEH